MDLAEVGELDSAPSRKIASPRLTILNVAYPLAPVGPDAVGGAEQVLSMLDAALVAAGHHSLVVACGGSAVSGELIRVPGEAGVLDDAARRRAWALHRAVIAEALARRRVDVAHLHGLDFHAYLPVGVPTLVTLHLPLSWYPPEALCLRRPNLRFTCVSAAQQATLAEPVAFMPPIPNGVPVETLNARHAKRGFVLILGRICPEKGNPPRPRCRKTRRRSRNRRRPGLSVRGARALFPRRDRAAAR